jgi:hypothetical protein
MTLITAEDEVLSAAIAGVPRVAELIATVPAEDRSRALEAAEKSYLKTAQTLGYRDAGAQQWASAVMLRLRNRRGQLQAADANVSADIAKLTGHAAGSLYHSPCRSEWWARGPRVLI